VPRSLTRSSGLTHDERAEEPALKEFWNTGFVSPPLELHLSPDPSPDAIGMLATMNGSISSLSHFVLHLPAVQLTPP